MSRKKHAQKHRQWQRKLRYFYHRFVRLQGTPEVLARGLAIGIFSGWFPWFGLQIIIAIALASLLRGNKIVAAAATWVSNPLTYVPIFAFNFQVGQWLLGSGRETFGFAGLTSWKGVMTLGSDFVFTLFFGCFVVGIILAIASYFLGLSVVRQVRHQRLLRRKSRRHLF